MRCNGHYEIGFDENTPDTEPDAKPTDFDEVKNTHVINIENGRYRNAHFKDVFELPEAEPRFVKTSDGLRVYVKVYWFCRRPATDWPTILLLDEGYRIEENYTGTVVRNIGV